MFNEEDSQEGFTTVFKKSSDNAPSKSNDEIIDLTNNNNDDIIVMEEEVYDSTSPKKGRKKLSRNVVVNQMSENTWWRNPPSNKIRSIDSSDSNNNNMGKNSQINDDSELFRIDYAQDDNRPVLKTQNFICSDETILTGYKPNIKMNEKKLATAIKQAIGSGKLTKSANNVNIQYNEEPIYSNLTLEQQTIKAIFGKNGVIPSINSQKKDLVNIYSNNQGSGIYIIKCITKEIQKGSLGFGLGLDLLGSLNFCSDSLFIKSYDELLNEFKTINLERESICKLLGRLYNTACDSDDYFFLRGIPNYCCMKIKEWMTSDPFRKQLATQDQFRSVKDFLRVSMMKFKLNDREICQFAYDRAKYFSLDNQIKQEIKNECILILDLFAQKFLNNESQFDNNEEYGKSNYKTCLPKGAFGISKSSNENDRLILGGKRRFDYQYKNF